MAIAGRGSKRAISHWSVCFMKQIAAVVNQKRRAASAGPIQHVLYCIECMHTLRFILLPLLDCYCASNAHNGKQLLPHQYLEVSRDAVVNKDSNDTLCNRQLEACVCFTTPALPQTPGQI